MEKKTLRREILEKRNKVTPEERILAAREVIYRLSRLPVFNGADEILLYASYGSELPTREIYETALFMEKRIFFPKVEGQDMEFYLAETYEELAEGYRGIEEPSGQTERYQTQEGKRVLMLLPGSVYDLEGSRIGYGRGFYDRYLKRYPEIMTCGIGYDFQLLPRIASDAWDVPLQYVVTDKRVCSAMDARKLSI